MKKNTRAKNFYNIKLPDLRNYVKKVNDFMPIW